MIACPLRGLKCTGKSTTLLSEEAGTSGILQQVHKNPLSIVRVPPGRATVPNVLKVSLLLIAASAGLNAQSAIYFQTDFPADEFRSRWNKVYDRIGADVVALIQGAASKGKFTYPSQSNGFYYLTGITAVQDKRSRANGLLRGLGLEAEIRIFGEQVSLLAYKSLSRS
jgi:hypothetical protein